MATQSSKTAGKDVGKVLTGKRDAVEKTLVTTPAAATGGKSAVRPKQADGTQKSFDFPTSKEESEKAAAIAALVAQLAKYGMEASPKKKSSQKVLGKGLECTENTGVAKPKHPTKAVWPEKGVEGMDASAKVTTPSTSKVVQDASSKAVPKVAGTTEKAAQLKKGFGKAAVVQAKPVGQSAKRTLPTEKERTSTSAGATVKSAAVTTSAPKSSVGVMTVSDVKKSDKGGAVPSAKTSAKVGNAVEKSSAIAKRTDGVAVGPSAKTSAKVVKAVEKPSDIAKRTDAVAVALSAQTTDKAGKTSDKQSGGGAKPVRVELPQAAKKKKVSAASVFGDDEVDKETQLNLAKLAEAEKDFKKRSDAARRGAITKRKNKEAREKAGLPAFTTAERKAMGISRRAYNEMLKRKKQQGTVPVRTNRDVSSLTSSGTDGADTAAKAKGRGTFDDDEDEASDDDEDTEDSDNEDAEGSEDQSSGKATLSVRRTPKEDATTKWSRLRRELDSTSESSGTQSVRQLKRAAAKFLLDDAGAGYSGLGLEEDAGADDYDDPAVPDIPLVSAVRAEEYIPVQNTMPVVDEDGDEYHLKLDKSDMPARGDDDDGWFRDVDEYVQKCTTGMIPTEPVLRYLEAESIDRGDCHTAKGQLRWRLPVNYAGIPNFRSFRCNFDIARISVPSTSVLSAVIDVSKPVEMMVQMGYLYALCVRFEVEKLESMKRRMGGQTHFAETRTMHFHFRQLLHKFFDVGAGIANGIMVAQLRGMMSELDHEIMREHREAEFDLQLKEGKPSRRANFERLRKRRLAALAREFVPQELLQRCLAAQNEHDESVGNGQQESERRAMGVLVPHVGEVLQELVTDEARILEERRALDAGNVCYAQQPSITPEWQTEIDRIVEETGQAADQGLWEQRKHLKMPSYCDTDSSGGDSELARDLEDINRAQQRRRRKGIESPEGTKDVDCAYERALARETDPHKRSRLRATYYRYVQARHQEKMLAAQHRMLPAIAQRQQTMAEKTAARATLTKCANRWQSEKDARQRVESSDVEEVQEMVPAKRFEVVEHHDESSSFGHLTASLNQPTTQFSIVPNMKLKVVGSSACKQSDDTKEQPIQSMSARARRRKKVLESDDEPSMPEERADDSTDVCRSLFVVPLKVAAQTDQQSSSMAAQVEQRSTLVAAQTGTGKTTATKESSVVLAVSDGTGTGKTTATSEQNVTSSVLDLPLEGSEQLSVEMVETVPSQQTYAVTVPKHVDNISTMMYETLRNCGGTTQLSGCMPLVDDVGTQCSKPSTSGNAGVYVEVPLVRDRQQSRSGQLGGGTDDDSGGTGKSVELNVKAGQAVNDVVNAACADAVAAADAVPTDAEGELNGARTDQGQSQPERSASCERSSKDKLHDGILHERSLMKGPADGVLHERSSWNKPVDDVVRKSTGMPDNGAFQGRSLRSKPDDGVPRADGLVSASDEGANRIVPRVHMQDIVRKFGALDRTQQQQPRESSTDSIYVLGGAKKQTLTARLEDAESAVHQLAQEKVGEALPLRGPPTCPRAPQPRARMSSKLLVQRGTRKGLDERGREMYECLRPSVRVSMVQENGQLVDEEVLSDDEDPEVSEFVGLGKGDSLAMAVVKIWPETVMRASPTLREAVLASTLIQKMLADPEAYNKADRIHAKRLWQSRQQARHDTEQWLLRDYKSNPNRCREVLRHITRAERKEMPSIAETMDYYMRNRHAYPIEISAEEAVRREERWIEERKQAEKRLGMPFVWIVSEDKQLMARLGQVHQSTIHEYIDGVRNGGVTSELRQDALDLLTEDPEKPITCSKVLVNHAELTLQTIDVGNAVYGVALADLLLRSSDQAIIKAFGADIRPSAFVVAAGNPLLLLFPYGGTASRTEEEERLLGCERRRSKIFLHGYRLHEQLFNARAEEVRKTAVGEELMSALGMLWKQADAEQERRVKVFTDHPAQSMIDRNRALNREEYLKLAMPAVRGAVLAESSVKPEPQSSTSTSMLTNEQLKDGTEEPRMSQAVNGVRKPSLTGAVKRHNSTASVEAERAGKVPRPSADCRKSSMSSRSSRAGAENARESSTVCTHSETNSRRMAPPFKYGWSDKYRAYQRQKEAESSGARQKRERSDERYWQEAERKSHRK